MPKPMKENKYRTHQRPQTDVRAISQNNLYPRIELKTEILLDDFYREKCRFVRRIEKIMVGSTHNTHCGVL